MRLTWQNLTKPMNSRTLNGIWRYGRAWLRRDYRPEHEHAYNRPIATLEWKFGTDELVHLKARVDRDDHEITLSVAAKFFGLYLSLPLPAAVIEALPFDHLRSEWEGGHRSIGASLISGVLHYSLWGDDRSHYGTDPKWMQGTVDLKRMIFGRDRFEVEVLEEREVAVPMPEGEYKAFAKLERITQTNERFPWRTETRTRVRLDMGETPIWMPGKGESDYDQEDDGVYATSVQANYIEHAVTDFAVRLMNERRERTGSPNKPLTVVS